MMIEVFAFGLIEAKNYIVNYVYSLVFRALTFGELNWEDEQ